ncbi:unnamed protein product [Ambrosiozyma monospora]|uniref:Unnamed protein product n=1 Tax=Ambrosiozyma monospora TaxID=43982 RepID=A0ACB5U1Z9_AMBMO|nr:unnamed protein product [Ambrosiozyma monospora]
MKNSKSLQTTLNQRHFGNENLYRVPKKISPTHKIASANKTRKALEVISNKSNLNNNPLINLIDKTQTNNNNNNNNSSSRNSSLQPETQINTQKTIYQDDIPKTIVDELNNETEEEEIEDEEEEEQEREDVESDKIPEKDTEQEDTPTSPETGDPDPEPLSNAPIPMSPKWNPAIREQLQNVVKTYHLSKPDPSDEDTWDVAMVAEYGPEFSI